MKDITTPISHDGKPTKRRRSTGSELERTTTFSGQSSIIRSSSGFALDSANGSLEDSLSGDGDSNVNVVIRVRPLLKRELLGGDDMSLKLPGGGQIWVETDNLSATGRDSKMKPFTFNVVFEPDATQADVMEHSGIQRLIEMAIDGFSCTIFCYGQTGSGKTHTLTGPPKLFQNDVNMMSEEHGIIFRSFLHLFQEIEKRKEELFVLKASYIEIYNEKVIDLLNPGKNLNVRWSKKKRGFYVENQFSVECAELDDLVAVLEEGMRNRRVRGHNLNENSGRSHTILTISIFGEQKQSEDNVYISREGTLNFVDLAGSERTKDTMCEGVSLSEANNINKSLLVLGTCIARLSDSKNKNGHIPYRDSKLTKLLADSLRGTGVTLMIGCVSPAKSNIQESLNTLRYAARAKKIQTKPIIMMDPRDKLIVSLRRDIEMLLKENVFLKGQLHHLSGKGEVDNQVIKDIFSKLRRPMDSKLASKAEEGIKELDEEGLRKMLKEFMEENQILRSEQNELFVVRDMMARDHDLLQRENERLLAKIEELQGFKTPNAGRTVSTGNSVNSLDFTIVRPELMEETNIWTNPLSLSSTSLRLKESISNNKSTNDIISKELEKRKVGSSLSGSERIRERMKNQRNAHNSQSKSKRSPMTSPQASQTPMATPPDKDVGKSNKGNNPRKFRRSFRKKKQDVDKPNDDVEN